MNKPRRSKENIAERFENLREEIIKSTLVKADKESERCGMIGDDVRIEDTFKEIINHYKSRDCVGCPFKDVTNICDKSECRWEQLCEVLRGW